MKFIAASTFLSAALAVKIFVGDSAAKDAFVATVGDHVVSPPLIKMMYEEYLKESEEADEWDHINDAWKMSFATEGGWPQTTDAASAADWMQAMGCNDSCFDHCTASWESWRNRVENIEGYW